ncbi:hypothetical protein IFM89_007423, partial [Coptis chinensis]
MGIFYRPVTDENFNSVVVHYLQMESVQRHCFVMSPKEFLKATNEGDDVFLCEYEYDVHWHSFKRLAEIDNGDETMTVLSMMRNLRSEVDAGSIKPYWFVEINGLRLPSPKNIYKVTYESLSGHRVGWKKAFQLLNERFSDDTRVGKEDNQPCVLLIDELDLLVTRNQSVLYNILVWPTKPNSKLVVIGIANTMDLPEKLLPRISSRMGIQRLSFGLSIYQQLQEIISSHLKGIDAVAKQTVEFASRKVAAISRDARRALEICRHATELANYRIKKFPSIQEFASAGIISFSPATRNCDSAGTSTKAFFKGVETWKKETILKKEAAKRLESNGNEEVEYKALPGGPSNGTHKETNTNGDQEVIEICLISLITSVISFGLPLLRKCSPCPKADANSDIECLRPPG